MTTLTLGALLRAGGIAALALIAAFSIRDCLVSTESRPLRMTLWALILAPWATPALLLGYAYMPLALTLVRLPGWKEAAYDLALWLRLTPVAVCVLCFAPPPLSAQALHCFRLLPEPPSRWDRLSFHMRGAGRGPWAALALVFLLAFSEFELASLWTMKTWTVALFDAQVGGLPLEKSLWLARMPLLCALSGMLAGITALSQRNALGASRHHRPATVGRAKRRFALGYIFTAALLTLIGPFFRLLPTAATGLDALAGNRGLAHDVAFSLLLAFSAAAAAWLLTGEATRLGGAFGGVCAAPGLLGALLLSLLTLSLFQVPVLRVAYGTPIPLLAALTLLLLPFAWLLRTLLRRQRQGAAMHLAKQLAHSRLCWELKSHKTFWAGFMIFCWAYFDLTAASLLAPPGMTTAAVRLYNLIHYGRSPALAAMLCATIAAPIIGAGLAVVAARTLPWQGAWSRLMGKTPRA